MNDLFSNNCELRRIELPDADISYLQSLPLPEPDTDLLNQLIEQTPWRAEEIVVWGKRYLQPRLVAWFGDGGRSYTYSGIRFDPLPWTDLLLKLKAAVEIVAGAQFNSVLLNYYRDHRDSMGLHSDDEPELGRNPVIASLSLGEERQLVLKHRSRKDLKPVRLPLASGSLLLMSGETQHHWKHGIDKQRHKCGPRVNLTFRRIVS
jgi:alkylated DNA repair dioxygenase AlkB